MTDLLHELLAVAQQILDRGRSLLEQRGLGVTLVVHTSSLVEGKIQKAMVTTLSSRSAARCVLADTLVDMARADGANPENIADLIVADWAALAAGELIPPPQ